MVHRSDVEVPYRVNSIHFRLELVFDSCDFSNPCVLSSISEPEP